MAAGLEEYNARRNFNETGEPLGEMSTDSEKRLRFAVQHHMASRDHFDFRLELDGVLKSWAVPKGPSYDTRDKRLAIRVEDHPLAYRNCEGTIPKGEYGGGTVMLWDEGYWKPYGNPHKGLEVGELKFTLYGTRLKGRWVLIHIKSWRGQKDNDWLLIKETDSYANASDITQFKRSVRTGRTMEEIKNDPLHIQNEGTQKQSTNKLKKSDSMKGISMTEQIVYPDEFIVEGVSITHPNKVVYPELSISKGDVAHYYSAIASHILPYIENRLISSVRCPEGIDSACFFRRHPATSHKGIGSLEVKEKDGEISTYFYVETIEGLLFEIQMNTIEFHPWGSKVGHLEMPDTMVFDLDPDTGMGLDSIRQGVNDIRSILDDLSLTSFLKTSGGKGYHIVIPFKPSGDWNQFHTFARNIAELMEARWPKRYTTNSRKAARKGRIFVDYLRNARGATSIAPYSLRSREKATVSMPISWTDLESIAPDDITMKKALDLLKSKDPWEGYFSLDQKLKADK